MDTDSRFQRQHQHAADRHAAEDDAAEHHHQHHHGERVKLLQARLKEAGFEVIEERLRARSDALVFLSLKRSGRRPGTAVHRQRMSIFAHPGQENGSGIVLRSRF